MGAEWAAWNLVDHEWPRDFGGVGAESKKYTLKVAALIEACTSGRLTVTPESLHTAAKWTDFCRGSVVRLSENLMLYASGPKKEVLSIIKEEPGITKAAISRKVPYEWKRLGSILETLMQENSATCDTKHIANRDGQWYAWTFTEPGGEWPKEGTG